MAPRLQILDPPLDLFDLDEIWSIQYIVDGRTAGPRNFGRDISAVATALHEEQFFVSEAMHVFTDFPSAIFH